MPSVGVSFSHACSLSALRASTERSDAHQAVGPHLEPVLRQRRSEKVVWPMVCIGFGSIALPPFFFLKTKPPLPERELTWGSR